MNKRQKKKKFKQKYGFNPPKQVKGLSEKKIILFINNVIVSVSEIVNFIKRIFRGVETFINKITGLSGCKSNNETKPN